jgi:chemotaxis protein CheD
MLPEETRSEANNKTGKYGLEAMELLINGMLKRGASLDYLQAKVFGGGNVTQTTYNNVAQDNIHFAKDYLEKKGIPIVAQDIGYSHGRYIYFCPGDGVYSRKIKLKNKELEKWQK